MRSSGFVITLVFLLGFFGCGGPAWYVSRDVGGPEHVLVGYGEGETMAEARADAAREIAETLGVSVHSTGEMVTENGADGVEGFSRFHVSLVSKAILDDFTPVKQGKASGRYYVALSYDNRTLLQKLEEDRGRSGKGAALHTSGFKASLPFSYSLSFLGIASSDYRVVRRHGGWTIVVDQEVYPIAYDEWFRHLFVEKVSNKGLRVDVTPSGPLPSGAHYQVLVTPPRPTGYLSLYHVSESGQALTLMTNHPVISLDPILFPESSLYEGLEAIATGGKGSRDMLLATWTLEPMYTMVTQPPISETPLPETDERTFSYGDLLEHLNDALWASRFVWITR